ncbi:acyl carrier protein [Campylobacter cuniculorum]|uniref:acyl carrier protein n=1 Tax=Campylobacter cuniculorum TaxID=374106 RepID=UPI0023EFBBFA|nr:acyl carrier protein [Campylobacter cuniculorum]
MKINIQDIVKILGEIGVLADLNSLEFSKPLKDQGIDSLDMANLFLNIQEKYGINVGLEEAKELDTIEKIVNYLNK